jgi:deazaflavin-dependent oxidoreductase (nitroreductase family)
MHKSYSRLNVAVYKRTRGRVFGRFAGLPVLLLETKGRRTGRPRTTPLVYMDHPIGTLVVASDGGMERNPAWFKNLQSDPQATVWKRAERLRVRARELEEEERARVWPDLCRYNKGYVRYQAATQRRIPVVLLDPERRRTQGPTRSRNHPGFQPTG